MSQRDEQQNKRARRLDRRLTCVSGFWIDAAKLCQWPALISEPKDRKWRDKTAPSDAILIPTNRFLRGCRLLRSLHSVIWYTQNSEFWPAPGKTPGIFKNKTWTRIFVLALSDNPKIRARKNRTRDLKALTVELAFDRENPGET